MTSFAGLLFRPSFGSPDVGVFFPGLGRALLRRGFFYD